MSDELEQCDVCGQFDSTVARRYVMTRDQNCRVCDCCAAAWYGECLTDAEAIKHASMKRRRERNIVNELPISREVKEDT